MRWVVFILLLLGALFSLAAFAPAAAGQAGLLWPFAVDSQPIISFVGGLPVQSGGVVTLLLAGIAGFGFLAAAVGLFWEAVSIKVWTALVGMAVASSLLLYVLYLGSQMIVPILVDAVLLWGILTKRWPAEVVRMRTIQKTPAPILPLMRIPVPWVYVLAYLVGVGLQFLFPLTVDSAEILLMSRVVGLMLTAGGVLLAFSSLGIFRAAHTTTVPFETPAQLITWGPYRFTRNPMYVGLALIYLGVAGIQVQIWPVLVLPLLLIYVHRVVIPAEEARLREAFGDAYEQYCAKVRRWI